MINIIGSMILILGIVLSLISGYTAIPFIAFALKPTLTRVSFDDSDLLNQILEKSPSTRDLVAKLEEMGFISIGIKTEKIPLWGSRILDFSLGSVSMNSYASIGLSRNLNPFMLYFFTPFKNGGIVLTRNKHGADDAEGEDFSVRTIDSEDPVALIVAHKERVKEFTLRGFIPEIAINPEARIAATHSYYSSSYAADHIKPMDSPVIRGFLLNVLVVFFGIFLLAIGNTIDGG